MVETKLESKNSCKLLKIPSLNQPYPYTNKIFQ